MADCVSKEINRYNYLVSEMDSVYHEAALKLGLSDSALNILYAICDNGEGCLLQDICFYTGMSKQTINSALRKLEKEEVIYLEPLNAKSKKVYLTEKGEKLAGMTAMRILQIEDEIFASWKKEDVEKYLELTEKYLDCLREGIKGL
ncbi:MarR family transcriptional regulator [bacterium D16-51]|nr:MarR family transcriptional regulator [bacterium D16-59]RKI62700.1 MarR family transcriptional regulator [bacterium D16-51]